MKVVRQFKFSLRMVAIATAFQPFVFVFSCTHQPVAANCELSYIPFQSGYPSSISQWSHRAKDMMNAFREKNKHTKRVNWNSFRRGKKSVNQNDECPFISEIGKLDWCDRMGALSWPYRQRKKNINLLLPNPIFSFLICDSSCDKKIKEKNI